MSSIMIRAVRARDLIEKWSICPNCRAEYHLESRPEVFVCSCGCIRVQLRSRWRLKPQYRGEKGIEKLYAEHPEIKLIHDHPETIHTGSET